jgi:hypothetical protein
MKYPTNHPFSPDYVSQIPVTDSDIRAARARAYMKRMAEMGLPSASKQMAFAGKITRGECPTCAGPMPHDNRVKRVVNKQAIRVCKTCAARMDKAKVAA